MIAGQVKARILRTRAGHHQTLPSKYKSFNQSARRERNTKTIAVKGSLRSIDDTSDARPLAPPEIDRTCRSEGPHPRFDGNIIGGLPEHARPGQSDPPGPAGAPYSRRITTVPTTLSGGEDNLGGRRQSRGEPCHPHLHPASPSRASQADARSAPNCATMTHGSRTNRAVAPPRLLLRQEEAFPTERQAGQD
jgi:hypothetical protein